MRFFTSSKKDLVYDEAEVAFPAFPDFFVAKGGGTGGKGNEEGGLGIVVVVDLVTVLVTGFRKLSSQMEGSLSSESLFGIPS